MQSPPPLSLVSASDQIIIVDGGPRSKCDMRSVTSSPPPICVKLYIAHMALGDLQWGRGGPRSKWCDQRSVTQFLSEPQNGCPAETAKVLRPQMDFAQLERHVFVGGGRHVGRD